MSKKPGQREFMDRIRNQLRREADAAIMDLYDALTNLEQLSQEDTYLLGAVVQHPMMQEVLKEQFGADEVVLVSTKP